MSKELKYNIVCWISLVCSLILMGTAAYFLFKEHAPITSLLFVAIGTFFTEIGRSTDKKYRALKAKRENLEWGLNNLDKNEFDHE